MKLRRVGISLVVALSLGLVACGGSRAPASDSTDATAVAPVTTATTASTAAQEPDGERILAYDRHLSVDIGLRLAGTPSEDAAGQFLADKLTSFGYKVEVQPFAFTSDSARPSSLKVDGLDAPTTIALSGSGEGTVTGKLVSAGIGRPAELVTSGGAIALIERGELQFREKVANATAAGAIAVVLYNNQPGTFYGTLGEDASIPALIVSQEDGRRLLSAMTAGDRQAELSVGSSAGGTSHNVVAKPPSGRCDTVTGGHYDSIVGPGASDNGTGTSTVLEIANLMAQRGAMGNNCFVLFGAEEEGLLGSKAFVASLSSAEKQQIKVMLNLDMVGVGDGGWVFIGDRDQQQRMATVASDLGISARPANLPGGAGSDHQSFISAGIPAVMIYRQGDDLLHTPQDVIDRVRPELLEQAARMSLRFLESAAAGT